MKLREQPKIPEKRSKGRPFIKSSQSHRYPPQTTYIIMFMQWNTKDGMDIAVDTNWKVRCILIEKSSIHNLLQNYYKFKIFIYLVSFFVFP